MEACALRGAGGGAEQISAPGHVIELTWRPPIGRGLYRYVYVVGARGDVALAVVNSPPFLKSQDWIYPSGLPHFRPPNST